MLANANPMSVGRFVMAKSVELASQNLGLAVVPEVRKTSDTAAKMDAALNLWQ